MEAVITAVLRKVIFMSIIVGAWLAFDKYYLVTFDTWEVLKNDPKACAILLGLLAVAFALA
jgi:hypothetical protein